MPFDQQKHHRHSIRLDGFDYSQAGLYFVTLCAWRRDTLFGQITNDTFHPNPLGDCAITEWLKSADLRTEIELDTWVLMPNHLHGLVLIQPPVPSSSDPPKHLAEQINVANVGAHGRAPLHRRPRSLGSFIAGFKSAATTRINQLRQTPGLPVWQRNYYEHIVRAEAEMQAIRRYIQNNPLQWALDRDNPLHQTNDTAIDYLSEAMKRLKDD